MKNIILVFITLLAFSCTEPTNGQIINHNDIIGHYEAELKWQQWETLYYITVNSDYVEVNSLNGNFICKNIDKNPSVLNKYSFYAEAEDDLFMSIDFSVSVINDEMVYYVSITTIDSVGTIREHKGFATKTNH